MSEVLLVAVALGVWAIIAVFLKKPSIEERDSAWDTYLDNADGVGRYVALAGQSFARSSVVQKTKKTNSFDVLEKKLRLGGAFGGSIEIFLSVQVATLLLGGALLTVAFLTSIPLIFDIVLIGLGLVLPIWPYNEVSQKANSKSQKISTELPDFAELLVMVLPSMSVPQALAFTSEHTSGIVSDEMSFLVKTISSRTLPEDEAFSLCAERLGTPEGQQFVDGLREAYLEGTRVVSNLTAQAESMRKIAFQNQRALAKKLPTKLTFIMALHFLPLLFVLAFLPVIVGLGGVG